MGAAAPTVVGKASEPAAKKTRAGKAVETGPSSSATAPSKGRGKKRARVGDDGVAVDGSVSEADRVIQARFLKATKELRLLGYLKTSAGRPDIATRTVFDFDKW